MNRERILIAAGFSLPELVIACVLFALVIGGGAAMYTTAFKQAGRTAGDVSARNQAVIALRAIERELSQATSLSDPGAGGSGSHLGGCRNLRADGRPIVPGAAAFSSGMAAGCFHFCVRPDPGGKCGEAGADPPEKNPAPCLFYYAPSPGSSWSYGGAGGSPMPPVPDVDEGSCGQPLGGVVPELLASGLRIPGGARSYFERGTGGAGEGSAVRAAFVIVREGNQNHPELRYEVDSSIALQISPH